MFEIYFIKTDIRSKLRSRHTERSERFFIWLLCFLMNCPSSFKKHKIQNLFDLQLIFQFSCLSKKWDPFVWNSFYFINSFWFFFVINFVFKKNNKTKLFIKFRNRSKLYLWNYFQFYLLYWLRLWNEGEWTFFFFFQFEK